MARTVAEHLVDQLVAAGVKRIYGIVGDSLNPVVDAVRRTDGIGFGWHVLRTLSDEVSADQQGFDTVVS
ncbi:thiamine pyrophosphate-binding protein, partial [Isoptericola sp. NPDC060257]|uniref:thiamine pyrophosphate-binding protein n=1 Tax=Isoptericola sp. NPDC060257 TaxID=3347087 RepID=UPI003656597B